MNATEDLEVFFFLFYKEVEATQVKIDEKILMNLFIEAIHPKSVGKLVTRELDKFKTLSEVVQRTRAIWVTEKTNVTDTTSNVNPLQFSEKEINLIKKWAARGRGHGRGRGRGRSYRYNNNNNNTGQIKCYNCQGFGHIAKNCPSKEAGKETVAKK